MVGVMIPLAPNSRLVDMVVPSPNHGERRVAEPDMLLLHYTGMPDSEGALRWLCNPASEVSAHYVVFEDGRIVQCVPEARRAWHAGASSWQGETDINSRSIGIEIANAGHDADAPPYPELQIAALIELCSDILARNPIPPERVLGHSDVAPLRKRDPGEWFPWARMHTAGIGHWVEPAPLAQGPAVALGDAGDEAREVRTLLAAYGYGVTDGDTLDIDTVFAVTAFQRHFRPALVNGRADHSTIATLRRLLGHTSP